MKRKFKSGDRVKIKPTSPRLSYFFTDGVDNVGTVVGYDEDGMILVKFDNFTNGHSGFILYKRKGIKYDLENRQHLWVSEEKLCLLEGE